MTTPYDPPESNLDETAALSPPSAISGVFAVIGSVLSSLILVALGSFAFTLYSTIEEVSRRGSGDPKLMAGEISAALVPAILLALLSAFGLIISMAVVSTTSYRKRWFYRLSMGFAAASLLFFPVGTVLGALALYLFFVRRKQFTKQARS